MAHFREQRLKVVLEGESTDGEESEADRESRGVGLLATLGSSFNNYFQSVHDKRHTTSDHTLSQLPPLDHKIFLEISSKTHQILRTERERLGQLHFELFPQWYFELASGFNLLFYGYGSKKKLLTAFVGRYLSDMHQIVVNGYFPSINIKEIMTLILDSIVVHKGPCGTLVDQAQLILSYFSDPKRKHKSICIVVHNIDGDSLRNANAQTVLAMLAGHPQIHLIASIDHINAPLLWDTDKLSRFNWIWHDATTFEPLTIETSYEGSCLRMLTTMGQSEGTSLRGCQYILKSCTVNARKMFKLLAHNDGRGAGDPDDHDDTGRNGAGVGSKEKVGMTRKAFYQKCKEHFLVSNDITFKTQLREFLDHELIVETGSGTGAVGDIVYIPMNVELLKTVVADME
ncbi:origin recognition complex, subunit 2 [Polychytrium aggregatum]|uniref:origin recognition complex, subunit 2 n=1 Tax=Polychytrium aggregatum TaxID=110093 RepID=UPI0022FF11E2|nr:origin recognition complex, subunit 2 [Polychytrium aggregatum]KAI9193691.1 origin recognition complex, subunit 2 [Polychytrium aggregatum]